MSKKAYSYIRFSTPEQLKGDSLRRQLEASRAYAKQHGLVLDESLRDIGVSAFKGKNATEGALKKFIELVESGRVEKGSILILESLDRLSRQQVFTTLSLFSSILSAGVEIVTLADNQHYTAESINDVGQLMYSLISMSRSHEESAIKGKRSAASWESRRRRAIETKKPVTGQCAHWLRLSDDKSKFEVIEDRAAIIRQIYEKSIAGVGRRKITTDLNESGVKPFGPRANKWHESYVANILRSRSVIGEYQPTKGGEPVGDPIPDYYPAIVSEKTFYKAQAALKSRWRNNSGRKGVRFSNLFTGMCKCLRCADTFRYLPRGGNTSAFLLCDGNYMKSGCSCEKRWLYSEVEDAALVVLSEKVDWFSAFGGQKNSRQKLEDEIQVLQGELDAKQNQIDRFAELFTTADGAAFTDARERYTKAMDVADELRRTIEDKEAKLRTFTPTQEYVDRLSAAIFDLRFSQLSDADLYQLRAQVNASFRDAGLRLHFFEEGVIYEISTTGETGVILTEESSEALALLAKAEIVNLGLKGLKEKLLQIQSQP